MGLRSHFFLLLLFLVVDVPREFVEQVFNVLPLFRLTVVSVL